MIDGECDVSRYVYEWPGMGDGDTPDEIRVDVSTVAEDGSDESMRCMSFKCATEEAAHKLCKLICETDPRFHTLNAGEVGVQPWGGADLDPSNQRF